MNNISFPFDSIILSYNMHSNETLATSVGEVLRMQINNPQIYFLKLTGYNSIAFNSGKPEKIQVMERDNTENELLEFYKKISEMKKPVIVDLHNNYAYDRGLAAGLYEEIALAFLNEKFRGLMNHVREKKLAKPQDYSKRATDTFKKLSDCYLGIEIWSGDFENIREELVKNYSYKINNLLTELLRLMPMENYNQL